MLWVGEGQGHGRAPWRLSPQGRAVLQVVTPQPAPVSLGRPVRVVAAPSPVVQALLGLVRVLLPGYTGVCVPDLSSTDSGAVARLHYYE